jgi:hypothetical protein
MKKVQWFKYQKTQCFKLTPVGRLYKQEIMVRRSVVEFVEVYIFIYNGLNESSFYQVGVCLQVGSCMRIGFLNLSWISQVGSCMRIGFLNSQLDLRSTSWDLL